MNNSVSTFLGKFAQYPLEIIQSNTFEKLVYFVSPAVGGTGGNDGSTGRWRLIAYEVGVWAFVFFGVSSTQMMFTTFLFSLYLCGWSMRHGHDSTKRLVVRASIIKLMVQLVISSSAKVYPVDKIALLIYFLSITFHKLRFD
ncbi:hypothetical protein N9N03_02265 [Chlamydiia bacterium]|nr:hypothetical protein [Chlamydiia bacterium]